MTSHRWSVLVSLAMLAAARVASAEEEVAPAPRETGGAAAASRGAFLPFTVGASSESTYGKAMSGYDGARRAVVYDATADAHVVAGLSVRAGYASHDLAGQPSALLGARYQLLSQAHHGIDFGVGLFYLPEDIDGEGVVKASLLLGRRFGTLAMFGMVAYGQDPEGDDHRGELALGTLVPLAPAVFVGFDARVRGLVFSSDQKHDGVSEPVLDAVMGPLVHYALGPFVLTGQAGASALAIQGPHGSLRPTRDVRYGALGLLSAGFSL